VLTPPGPGSYLKLIAIAAMLAMAGTEV